MQSKILFGNIWSLSAQAPSEKQLLLSHSPKIDCTGIKDQIDMHIISL